MAEREEPECQQVSAAGLREKNGRKDGGGGDWGQERVVSAAPHFMMSPALLPEPECGFWQEQNWAVRLTGWFNDTVISLRAAL